MQKVFSKLALMAAVPFIFAACEVLPQPGGEPGENDGAKVDLTLRSAATRTYLENDKSVLWDERDEVQINNYLYDVSVDQADPSVAVVYDVRHSETGYYAGYPCGYLYDDVIEVRLDPWQEYRKDSFGWDANPMLAYSEDTDLMFHNVASVLKLGITGKGQSLASVHVSGNNGEIMGGYMLFGLDDVKKGDYSNYTFYTEDGDAEITSVSLYFDEEEANLTLSPSPAYVYVVIPSRTYTDGITVTMTDTEGNICIKKTGKAIEAKRSEIIPMSTFEFQPTAVKVGIADLQAAPASVTFNVTGEPGSNTASYLVSKKAWDLWVKWYIEDEAEYDSEWELARDFLTDLLEGEIAQIGEDGKASVTIHDAIYSDAYGFMFADTEYILWTSYSVGLYESVGEWKSQTFKTAAATGAAPSLTVTRIDSGIEGKAKFHVDTDAKAMRFLSGPLSWFNNYKEDLKVDMGIENEEEFILYSATCIWTWDDGYDEFIKNQNISADKGRNGEEYVFAVAAVSEGGQVAIEKIVYDVEYYAGAEWEVVSENALFDCGSFREISGNWENIVMTGLTVEKKKDADIFRIKNLFSTSKTPVLASLGFQNLAGDYYTYIDATRHDAIVMDGMANNMGITKDGFKYFYGNFIYDYYYEDGDYWRSDGTYDAEKGIIDIYSHSIIAIGPDGEQWLYAYESTLYFDARSNSMDVENFEMEDGKTEW